MAKNICVAVNNRIATYIQRGGAIVCGNSDYTITFTFDSEWEAHEVKTARFLYNGITVDVVFEGNIVEVPILRNTTSVSVGVFAGNLQTTTPAVIPCMKSILCDDGVPPDPEPDVYTQIMEMLSAGGGGKPPVSIDLSKLDTEGKIAETYADGTIKTTTIEFDEDGNPVKITDGDGNETVLVWKTVIHTITCNAPNCTIDFVPESIEYGGRIEGYVTTEDGYHFDTVQIIMGGVDITETSFHAQGDEAQFSIQRVTGDVVVTITTKQS